MSTTKEQNDASFSRVFKTLFRLETIKDYSAPLIEAWSKILIEDNRRGVMTGTDGDGNPMKPTKYRKSLTQTAPGRSADAFFNASGEAFSNMEGEREFFFANLSGGPGVGHKPGTGDNLTTREYQKMTGPPLAPRGAASRVISNYTVEPVTDGNTIGVEGGWDDVVSKKGVEFLPFHFHGATFSRAMFAASIGGENHHLPRRNLIGLRQWGKTQARKELNAWVKWLLTQAQVSYFGRKEPGHAPNYVTLSRKRA